MKTILYDITSFCNLKCSHCYNANILENTPNDNDNYKKVLIYINDLKDVERVHVLGGEPLTFPSLGKFINELNKNIHVSINTNGTLLSKYKEYFAKNNTIDQITISLDGYNAELNDDIRGKGSFNLVYREILNFNEFMKKNNRKIGLNIAYVITPKNYKSLFKLIDLSKSLSIKNLLISFLYYEGNSKNLKDQYDFEDVSKSLIKLFNRAKDTSIDITIDVKPIILLYWKLIFNFKNNFDNIGTNYCYALENMRYISNKNRIYPCGPSSKLSEDNCIMDLNTNTEYKKSFISKRLIKNSCSDCIYSDNCAKCPIGVECASEEFCDFANQKVNDFLNDYFKDKMQCYIDLLNSNIIKSMDSYKIVNFENRISLNLGKITINCLGNTQLEEVFNCTSSKKDRLILMLGIYEALENNIIKLIF